MDHTDVRYLASKRTVDERARSRRVRDRLLEALPESPDVVDAGAGTGAMLRNLLSWGVQPRRYQGVDRSGALVEHARRTAPRDLAGSYDVDEGDGGLEVEGVDVRFEPGDVLDLPAGSADLVVAQALLDLVPPVEAMDAIERALAPGGLAYLPITFDGVSIFLPAHPDDRAVVDAYHAAIDGAPGRDSRAGRRLLEHLPDRGGELLAVDSSDWIVRPRGDAYPDDEAYFLGCVLDFVEAELEGSETHADDWLSARRRQLAEARLAYVAHGYDFLYQAPTP